MLYVTGSVTAVQTASSASLTTGVMTPKTGNIIIIGIQIPSATVTVSQVTDSVGNTYTKRKGTQGTAISGEVWASPNAARSGTGITITITLSGALSNWAVAAAAYSGVALFDVAGSAVDTNGTSVFVSVSPQNPAEVIVAHLFLTTASTTSGLTPTGYTDIPGTGTSYLIHQSFLLGGTAGINNFSETITTTQTEYIAFAVALTPIEWTTILVGGRPFVTVSPVGVATGLATLNNGADFGPDTPGTLTGGLQEWLNYIGSTQGGAGVQTAAIGKAIAGTYTLQVPLNFALAFPNGATGVEIDLSGTTLQPSSGWTSATGTALVELVGPSYSYQLWASRFAFGSIMNPNKYQYPLQGIVISDVAVCDISIQEVSGFGTGTAAGSGVLLHANYYGGNGDVVFNCFIRIQEIYSCGNGLATIGNSSGPYQVSANIIQLGQVTINKYNGIAVDATGTLNTQYNTFLIGVVEHNTLEGIKDWNGGNIYMVSNTNSNNGSSPIGFALAATAVHAPFLIGQFTDGVNLSGLPGRIVDVSTKPGWITAPPLPSGTGSGNAVSNQKTTAVRIYQKPTGSASNTVIVDASKTPTALPTDPVEFVLDPGCSVYYNTTVPSSWVWFRT